MKSRHTLLTELLAINRPLALITQELSEYPSGSNEEILELRRAHIVDACRRVLSGNLTTFDLSRWADTLEGREDLKYQEGKEKELATALFELSSPEINSPLNSQFLTDLITRLDESAEPQDRSK